MKSIYDEYEKYDVNKDEEFLKNLSTSNAFAYYLIRNNAKRPYKKSGLFSKTSENSSGLFENAKGLLENPTVNKQLQRIGKSAASGVLKAVNNKVKNLAMQKTAQLLASKGAVNKIATKVARKALEPNNLVKLKRINGTWRI